MSGAGIKLFVSGEVAYASEVNQYLMDQSIARFANIAARTAAYGDGVPIGSGGSGKPALAEGMFCYLLDNSLASDGSGFGEVQFYDGSQWVAASNFSVEDGTITTVKLADDAVTGDKIADNSITSAHIAAGTVIASDISDNTITEAKLTTSVAGSGLTGGNGTALAVNVDSSTIEISSDTLRIASGAAGSGLSGGGGSALAVSVDDSTIEINSDSLRVKDAGITSAKLAANISLSGTTELEEIIEAVVINATALTGTVNIDAKSGAVHYFTSNSSANWIWNLRGDGSTTLNSMMNVGQSATFALFATNGGTAYKPTSLTIDTTGTVSVKWFGGNSYPSGNSSSVDVYTITVIKTAANTYTAFASQSKFA